MDVIVARCAGLDVHKMTVQACAWLIGRDRKARDVLASFGTTTGALRALRDWLKRLGVTHVAMESTGVFWRPIWNILEGHFKLLLVNARHMKNVPGARPTSKTVSGSRSCCNTDC